MRVMRTQKMMIHLKRIIIKKKCFYHYAQLGETLILVNFFKTKKLQIELLKHFKISKILDCTS